ncbi:MAG: S46 family peptidase [Ignavibacteriales bacterium]|nr:S46 family peptidase [Ignavibacteriales bacterium]
MKQSRMKIPMALLAFVILAFGCSSRQQTMKPEQAMAVLTAGHINLDTVKAGRFDTGRMWTFDFPPMEYFSQTYGFNPTKEWFEKARMSSLRLPGCTAAFVSEDGLLMTNHHCARGALDVVNKEGEKLAELGFYAPTLDQERKSPVTYVDQLVLIEDVSKEVLQAFESGATDSAKTANRMAKMQELQRRYAAKFKETTKDSMIFNVISFYNGGRFSLYAYKRYTDVRLVYAPEQEIAFFGGDPDNFTYPRYDFDVSFFRVYDDGKPVKTSNFFMFSKEGAKEGEAVFVIGNPGTTNRLQTVAQLETFRDYNYPLTLNILNGRYSALSSYVEKHPDQRLKYMSQIFGISNSIKAVTGYLGGLRDPYLMARKKDFEKSFKNAVLNNANLRSQYGDPWTDIASLEEQRRALLNETNALNLRARSAYLAIAANLVDYANISKTSPERIPPPFRPERIQATRTNLIPEIETALLSDQLAYMKTHLGGKNEVFNRLLNNRTPAQAAEDIAKNSLIANKEKFDALMAGKPDDILTSADPVLSFAVQVAQRFSELQSKLAEMRDKQGARVQVLGKAMYEVYGTSIPPDATFTLRIADGVVKGYEYNGTIAPPVTTFYGMYDRYFSFGKKEPWNLPGMWANPPSDFNMSTPINFVSTNDIIGGNSGSSVINKDLQVVGLIFDGNIESLPGNIILEETKNRAVSVHTAGILEGLEKIYKADRIVKELRAGKITP